MDPRFEAFPPELLLMVAEHLGPIDICSLLRVSRRFHECLESVLWGRIEWHNTDIHGITAYPAFRDAEKKLRRPYPRDEIPSEPMRGYMKDRFYKIFGDHSDVPKSRQEHLAGLIRWLCCEVPHNGYERDLDEEEDTPSSLPGFKNLLKLLKNVVYLSIDAVWTNYPEGLFDPASELYSDGDAVLLPFNNLRTLRLSGYLSPQLVRHVCKSAAELGNVTSLELSLLDRPIGTTLQEPRQNPPPEDDSVEEDSAEDFDRETICPRPLACLEPGILDKFRDVRHLSLCKPAEPTTDGWEDICYSQISDQRCLEEWKRVIQVARPHLEILVLDQRVCAPEIEQDSTDAEEYMYLERYGPSYERFIQTVWPVLSSKEEDFPNLREVHLHGFEMPRDTLHVGISRSLLQSHDMEKALKERFPGIKIVVELGRRLVFEEDSGEVPTINFCAGAVMDSVDNFSHLDWTAYPMYSGVPLLPAALELLAYGAEMS